MQHAAPIAPIAAPVESPAHVTAGLAVGTIALLMLGLQPILLGELVNAGRVTLESVGLVATAEIIALGLGVVAGGVWQPFGRLRTVCTAAALLAAAFDLLSAQVSGDVALIGMRAGAGIAEGLLLWACTGVIVRTPSPDRVAGIFFVAQTVAQALGSVLLAQVVVPAGGLAAAFGVLAGATALALVPTAWLPRGLVPLAPAAVTGFRWSAPTLLPLAIVFLQLAAVGSLWAYIEPLGKAAGLDARAAQTMVAGVLVAQMVGGCSAAAVVRRLPLTAVLALGSVLLAGAAAVIHGTHDAPLRFAAACAAFGFAWLFVMPFQVRLGLRADPGGRVATMIPAGQLFGTAFGPLLASFFVHGEEAGAVPLVSGSFAITALLAVLLGAWLHAAKAAPRAVETA